MSFAEDDLEYILVNEGGFNPAEVFQGALPPTTTEGIMLAQYSGRKETVVHDQPRGNERPGIQVKVRSATYDVARFRIYQVNRLLTRYNWIAPSGTRYVSIVPAANPALLERDDQARRVVFVDNFYIEKGVD